MEDEGVLVFSGVGGHSAHWSLVKPPMTEHVRTALVAGQSIQIVFFTWSAETAALLESVMDVAASLHSYPFPIQPLLLSLQELSLNGVKANMKKVALEQFQDVCSGMAFFNNQLGNGATLLSSLVRKERYWTAIVLRTRPEYVRLDVINATPLLPEEEKRIRHRLALVRQYDSVEGFHQAESDLTEGAGLGLYLAGLGLRSCQVRRRRLHIRSDRSGHTVARVSLAWDKAGP